MARELQGRGGQDGGGDKVGEGTGDKMGEGTRWATG